MKLSEICKETGISKRTVHYYIQEGLISPSTNEHNGYYIFTEEDCKKLKMVRCLRNAKVSIADIHSIIDNPATVNYYLSLHIKALRRELRFTQQTINSMNYVLTNSPLHPDLTEVQDLINNADIPDPDNISDKNDFDLYDISLTNKYLWGSFLTPEPFSDYQDFLWNKLQRIAMERYSDDYIKLDRHLYSMSNSSIDRTFVHTQQHYIHISELTSKDFEAYSKQLIEHLYEIPENTAFVSMWKRNYDDFYGPTVRIHSSPLSDIVAEISPFFASYKKNINAVCNMVYDWIMSPDGEECLESLKNAFGSCLDIHNYDHGQLEALASLIIVGFDMM
ncbi:MerR family transcriptional regulator [Clostridiales Family XIII bacterium RF-744-FAT-WT-3]|uniref:MerR family transcriptional regulator n=1 Tax=Baileyella intestinalis TaxID=2606709 RepID=A0A6A8MCC0_9FIRM|nr:MerR family transcriptional regulator [Baileyella intestinalis]MST69147.1 MerR family transcriptional regulator [Baileyella intestinalis]